VKGTAVTVAELVRRANDEAKDGEVDSEEEEDALRTGGVDEEEEETFFQRTLNDGIAEGVGVGVGGGGGGGRRSSGGGGGGITGDTSAEIISAAALEGSDLSAVAAARGSVEGEVPGGLEREGRGKVGGESVERVGLAPGARRDLTPGPEGDPRRPRPVPKKHLGVLDDPEVYEVLYAFFCLVFFIFMRYFIRFFLTICAQKESRRCR
jgi:hypothetical protein